MASIRWGILGTGWVSTNFVKDLVLPRANAPIHYIVQAIGTSDTSKGNALIDSFLKEKQSRPTVYTNYDALYADKQVDIVYVGITHALHKQACLAAIEAGKHVLGEKPLTINRNEAEEVIAAAKAKGVFLMEAVWTRFFPLIQDLQQLLHHDKILGSVTCLFCDFGIDMDIASLPATSRLKSRALGAGALLDIGIYPLTLSTLILDGKVGDEASNPEVCSSMVIVEGIDLVDAIVAKYLETQRLGILSASMQQKSPEAFCRIEGSKGSIVLTGSGASMPRSITILLHGEEEQVKVYDHPGMGFHFEADAVAMDIKTGRVENEIMPWAETLRMMGLMDGIRKKGGVGYPQDELKSKEGTSTHLRL